MKIFFYTLRPWDERPFAERLAAETGIEFDGCEAYPSLENAHLAAGCDAVSMTPCDMGPAMVRRFHELGVKYLCCRSIGYDHVDRETARALGMRVSNVDYPEVQDYSLQGKIGRDLSGCTVGVIGTGHIGRTVLQHLSGFGCKLLAYDLYPSEEAAQYARYVDFDTLCAESDVITLHTNATAENHHLIDAAALARMKQGAVIVNTARGSLIDSKALIDALESGHIGAAALDVLENENGLYYYNRAGDPIANTELALLRSFPNVLLTCHTAFYTDEDVESMVRGVFESAAAFAKGEPTRHDVSLA